VTASSAGRPAIAEDAGGAGALRLAERLPEPGHLWIRFAPRGWEGPDRPWLDLAAGRLGRSSRRPASPVQAAAGGDQPGLGSLLGTASVAGPPLDDLLYLPPVPAQLAGWRDALAERALAAGTPVLVQLLPGDATRLNRPPAPGGPSAVVVIDLLAALLPGGEAHDGDGLARLIRTGGVSGASGVRQGAGLGAAAGLAETGSTLAGVAADPADAGAAAVAAGPGVAAAVWPLLPGITDDPALWERACARLAAAGVECLQAVVPAFGPGDRRRLAQGQPEGAFSALFHRQPGQPSAERDFARAAHRHGLAPFLARPLPHLPLARRENRRLAGQLALIAELWLRLGRPVERAQSLFRAARWLDATAYDAGSLSREGNLGVVTALDPLARRAVEEAAAGGEPALLGELMAEYLAA